MITINIASAFTPVKYSLVESEYSALEEYS